MPNKMSKKGYTAVCSACDSTIQLRKLPFRGQVLSCTHCNSLLRVVQASPLILDWAFEEPIEDERQRSERAVDKWDQPQYSDDTDGYASGRNTTDFPKTRYAHATNRFS